MLFNSRPRFISFVSILIVFFFGFFFLTQEFIQQDDFVNASSNWLKVKFKTYLSVKNKFDHGKWTKILSHQDFPDYQIRLKEPKLCDSSVQQYSGYLDINEEKHFFFWFFESRNDPRNDPIVLWLNGGPGCSSLTGLFFELGPCTVNEDEANTTINSYSWNSNASIIFLDQPMNVGYSHGSKVSSSHAAAIDVYAFLQIFFQEYSQYARLDFHIAGESYAGHYIPAIAAEINNNNHGTSLWILEKNPKFLLHINLESILIGNGMVDPLVQYNYYADMACNSSYGPVLDNVTCDRMRYYYPNCAKLIKECYDGVTATCLTASMYCDNRIVLPYYLTHRNPYDVRKQCEGSVVGMCYPGIDVIERYLNRDYVREELGVVPWIKYGTCSSSVHFRFQMTGDLMKPFHILLPPLLENGIRILIYAGDADFICNWIGNNAWTKELEWSGKQGFNDAKTRHWKVQGDKSTYAGEVRSHKGLTFLRVFEAGHMVPYDKPRSSLDLLNRWLLKKRL
ncbi:peptidase S10, serine carboxypeptidase [Gigaspora margarita]|uniref:Carboxypeptidase n=1 Tax=Gigaspora margarita TaxID=4874 RepID=A0A8H3X5J5_GIGMA|nr:peptidase S10, serine carboxypeptidase [Gigaspora margarita]